MFKWLHEFFKTNLDRPSILSKINTWAFSNIKYLKYKNRNIISIFILSLDGIKTKFLSFLKKDFNFDYFYIKYVLCLFFFFILMLFI